MHLAGASGYTEIVETLIRNYNASLDVMAIVSCTAYITLVKELYLLSRLLTRYCDPGLQQMGIIRKNEVLNAKINLTASLSNIFWESVCSSYFLSGQEAGETWICKVWHNSLFTLLFPKLQFGRHFASARFSAQKCQKLFLYASF